MLPLMLLVAVACQPAEQQVATTGPDVEAITAWLPQVATAVNAGDVEGVLALYADDAVFSPPDAPTLTVDELRALYEVMFGESTFDFRSEPIEVVVSGDLGVLRASYTETVTPTGEGEPYEQGGTWLVVLRKQPDGSWKLWRDMWSVVPPPEPTP
jgi:uncharacterized protein (TIGR02246 family)